MSGAKLRRHERTILDEAARIDVWVTYRLSGGLSASRLHGCSLRTVYRIAQEIEADADLERRAQSAVDEARAGARARLADRAAETVHACLDAIRGAVVAGRATPEQILEAVRWLGPICAAPETQSGPTVRLPSILTTPRSE